MSLHQTGARRGWSAADLKDFVREADVSPRATADVFGNHLMDGQKWWGFAFVSARPLKSEKSATKRLIQQISDKLQPDTLKSRQICLNACVFYGEVGGKMETEHCA